MTTAGVPRMVVYYLPAPVPGDDYERPAHVRPREIDWREYRRKRLPSPRTWERLLGLLEAVRHDDGGPVR